MKKPSFMILIFLFLFVQVVQSADKIAVAPIAEEQIAKKFVALLIEQQFEKAVENFDDNMKAAVPPRKLTEIWIGQLNRLGACQSIQRTRTEIYQQYRFVFVTCQFEKQQMDVKVVIDKTNKIAGLFFKPTKAAEYRPPAYAKTNLFLERNVTVGAGEWALPGTLSIPAGKGLFPAVLLVHGSGPHDRDESIGPNKPFRDLAWGLASQGIMVLRYEKRTKQYPARTSDLERFTVEEETIDDALAALSILHKAEHVDKNRVFLLGHSLGGMLAPRICAGHSGIAGLIIMAGNARPLEDLVLEQTIYQASLGKELPADAKRRLDEVKRQVAAVKELSTQTPSKGMLLHLPTSYWVDLQGYDPTDVARSFKRPMLILQGENDCQVNPKIDFERWRKALCGRTDVVLKSYPSLNHLFMYTATKSTGAEYQPQGNVAGIVVSDIAAWIKD